MSTSKLLNSIGFPKIELPTPQEPVESGELYDLARKNKIGSLYVKVLDEHGEINQLSAQWNDRRDFQRRLRQTLNGLPENVPSDFEYAIVKSGHPWVDSKDIDLVLFEDRLEELEKHFTSHGYELCGRSPTSFDVLDPETQIQLDVQSNFSLQRVIYFDKGTVSEEVEYRDPYGTSIPFLSQPADLALVVIHSVTEQMYILKEFYTAISMLESFSQKQIDRFIQIVEKNEIGAACSAFFTISLELCRRVFGRSPPYLWDLLDKVGYCDHERSALVESGLQMPHKYTGRTGAETVAGKMYDRTFRQSLLSQVPRLMRPTTAYYILSQVFTRRGREHYVHDTSDMTGEANKNE